MIIPSSSLTDIGVGNDGRSMCRLYAVQHIRNELCHARMSKAVPRGWKERPRNEAMLRLAGSADVDEIVGMTYSDIVSVPLLSRRA